MPVTPPSSAARAAHFGEWWAVILVVAGLAVSTPAGSAQPPEPGGPPASVEFDPKTVSGKVADFAEMGQSDTPGGQALSALLLHGRHFSLDALTAKAEEFPAAADPFRKSDTDPASIATPEFRFRLLKFSARLSRITRLAPPPDVAGAGIDNLYEVKAFPADQPNPVYVVISRLPKGFTEGDQSPTGPRATFAAYFLKVVRYRDGSTLPAAAVADRFAPLLVAPTFAVATPKSKFEFDGERLLFNGIRDFVSLQDGDRFAEATAYEDLVRHARQFEGRELAAAAEDVPVTELLRRKMASVPSTVPGMPPEQRLRMERPDFRFKLLKTTGQLKRIVRVPVPPDLATAGVTDLYEAWVLHPERDEAVCFVFTELPPDLAPSPELKPSKTVTVAGYFLKVIRYETQETGANDKPVVRFAPMTIGRTITPAAKPDLDGGQNWRTVFLPSILIGLGLITALFLGLMWWFRSSDRASRKAIADTQVNPFGPADEGSVPPNPPSG